MRKDAGFSLVSVLIAMVLLSVGILAFARTSAQILKVHSEASGRTTAVTIARGHMEVVRGSDASLLVSQAPVVVNSEGQVDANGNYLREVIVEDIEHNLRQVKVRVLYPRADQPVELVTLAFVGDLSN